MVYTQLKLTLSGCFETSTTEHEKEIMYELLDNFNTLAEKHEIDTIACSGTWIGAVRHNDFIPWDDDLDVAIKKSDLDKVPLLIKDMKDIYGIESTFYTRKHAHSERMFKFYYPNLSPKAIKKFRGHNWPFLDIFHETKENTSDDCYISEEDYPFTKEKFGPLELNIANREFPSVIRDTCVDYSYRHKYEFWYPEVCLERPCSDFLDHI